MIYRQGPHIHVIAAPRTGLIERVVYFLLGLLVLVLAFFFIGIALVAGAVLAGVLALRWWWLKRKLQRAHEDTYVDGEYVVVEQALEHSADTASERQK